MFPACPDLLSHLRRYRQSHTRFLPWLSVLGLVLLVELGSVTSVRAAPPLESGKTEKTATIAQVSPLLAPDRFDRTTIMREANRHLREQNYSDAETLFLQLIDRDPRDAVLHYKLGIALAAQFRDSEAETAYRRAIELEDRYVLALNGLGELYSNQSRWIEALRLFEQAVDIEASYTDAQFGLGQALWQLGRDHEAIAVLEIVVEQLVDREELWRAIAVSNLIQQIKRGLDIV